jgi:hypothetical protein
MLQDQKTKWTKNIHRMQERIEITVTKGNRENKKSKAVEIKIWYPDDEKHQI